MGNINVVNPIGSMIMKKILEYLFKPCFVQQEQNWQNCCYNRMWIFMAVTFCNPLLLCVFALYFGFTKQYNMIGIMGIVGASCFAFTMMQMVVSEIIYKKHCEQLIKDS